MREKPIMPWYLKTWLIVAFAFLSGMIPWLIPVPIIMLIFHLKKNKIIKSEVEKLNQLRDSGFQETIDLTSHNAELSKEIEEKKAILPELNETISLESLKKQKQKEVTKIEKEIASIQGQLEKLSKDYVEMEDEVLMQQYGFYEPKYDLIDSSAYKARLKEIRDQQKEMVRKKTAASFSTEWQVNGSKAEGRKMINNYVQLSIRSFNNECDVAISKVTVSNVESMRERIKKTFERINKLNKSNNISLTSRYLNLKLDELDLALEYALKVEREKEEQREIREQMREEEKARREIAKLREKVEKEEQHFLQAIQQLEEQMGNADSVKVSELEQKIAELQEKLKEVQLQKEDVLNRERNTRAGYVYIISNVGSFGENIYKIGMTRRLEPLDRVKELGDASVPFHFDVHAMIFSEDAPSLETILHQTFTNRRVNMINERKEFFKVSLEEIKKVVEENYNKTVEFKMTAKAEEYRETKALIEREKSLVNA